MAPALPWKRGRLAAALAYLVTALVRAILAWDSRRSVRRELERSLLPAWSLS
jgi:hypothetical protein